MAKEFNKKFMHPTRRKLVDMVMHGAEYEKESFISFSGADKEIIKRKVGEKWTDGDGKSWEQLEAGKVQTSELGDIMADARAYLDKLNSCKSDKCKTIKIGRVDKKLISKTGYCLHCLALREAQIKYDGLWKEYEDYKIYSNMISYGNDVVAQFQQAYNDAKQEYEYVNEDGTAERWELPKSVEEVTAEIQELIEIGKKEIEKMKTGVGIVNAARGGVIDEMALISAIETEKVKFAGLDVFEKEPAPEIQLLMNPELSLTPHIGAATAEAQDRIGTELAQQIIEILK